jgi:hypothetical protein
MPGGARRLAPFPGFSTFGRNLIYSAIAASASSKPLPVVAALTNASRSSPDDMTRPPSKRTKRERSVSSESEEDSFSNSSSDEDEESSEEVRTENNSFLVQEQRGNESLQHSSDCNCCSSRRCKRTSPSSTPSQTTSTASGCCSRPTSTPSPGTSQDSSTSSSSRPRSARSSSWQMTTKRKETAMIPVARTTKIFLLSSACSTWDDTVYAQSIHYVMSISKLWHLLIAAAHWLPCRWRWFAGATLHQGSQRVSTFCLHWQGCQEEAQASATRECVQRRPAGVSPLCEFPVWASAKAVWLAVWRGLLGNRRWGGFSLLLQHLYFPLSQITNLWLCLHCWSQHNNSGTHSNSSSTC